MRPYCSRACRRWVEEGSLKRKSCKLCTRKAWRQADAVCDPYEATCFQDATFKSTNVVFLRAWLDSLNGLRVTFEEVRPLAWKVLDKIRQTTAQVSQAYCGNLHFLVRYQSRRCFRGRTVTSRMLQFVDPSRLFEPRSLLLRSTTWPIC
jgi:hypothetical protein